MTDRELHQKRINTAVSSPSLEYMGISVVSFSLEKADIEYLAERIPANKRIPSLQLAGNHLSDESIPALVKVLEKLPNLEKLDLSYNNFSGEGIAALSAHLPRLQELDVSRNPLKSSGGTVLADMVKAHPTLRGLEASHCELADEGMHALIGGLQENRTLAHLNIAQNDTSAETNRHTLGALLQNNRTLTRITTDDQHVRDHGDLQGALRNTPNLNLTKFYVISEGNDVTGITGAPVFSSLLTKNFDAANTLRGKIRSDWQKLNGKDLRDIETRHNAIFDPTISNLPPGKRESYEAFVDGLPKLPSLSKATLPDALFEEDAQGFAPLDNPRLLTPETRDQFVKSIPLDAATVSKRTERGSGMLDVLSQGLSSASLVDVCLSNGTRLGSAELLDAGGKPSELLQRFIDKNDIAPLFSLENWQGKSRAELGAVYAALPKEAQAVVPYFSLSQQMKVVSDGKGVGR